MLPVVGSEYRYCWRVSPSGSCPGWLLGNSSAVMSRRHKDTGSLPRESTDRSDILHISVTFACSLGSPSALVALVDLDGRLSQVSRPCSTGYASRRPHLNHGFQTSIDAIGRQPADSFRDAGEQKRPQRDYWNERGRAASVSNSNATGRTRRSVPWSFAAPGAQLCGCTGRNTPIVVKCAKPTAVKHTDYSFAQLELQAVASTAASLPGRQPVLFP